MSTDSTLEPDETDPASPAPAQPAPALPAPARPAAGRDRVTRLFARALEDDPAAGATPRGVDPATQEAVNEAFRELIELAYAGDSRAERAMRAILDVEVARADTDATMPTPTQLTGAIDQAWAAHHDAREDGRGRGGDVAMRPDGSVRFGDDTDGPDPSSGLD